MMKITIEEKEKGILFSQIPIGSIFSPSCDISPLDSYLKIDLDRAYWFNDKTIYSYPTWFDRSKFYVFDIEEMILSR